MHIGIDFDNTIVCYDNLFHKVALEGGWIDKELPNTKLSVRDYLRSVNNEIIWTKLQGYVYGARMNEAIPYAGVIKCLIWARNLGISVSIVSHKSKYPFIGEQYDLHCAARNWIDLYLTYEGKALVSSDQIYFELTKEAKIKRIVEISCTTFIDDLPEILFSSDFPDSTSKILFDPDMHHINFPLNRSQNWNNIKTILKSQWKAKI